VADPDWVVVCPCGFDMEETKRELARITGQVRDLMRDLV
jgi:hypothetical protein